MNYKFVFFSKGFVYGIPVFKMNDFASSDIIYVIFVVSEEKSCLNIHVIIICDLKKM